MPGQDDLQSTAAETRSIKTTRLADEAYAELNVRSTDWDVLKECVSRLRSAWTWWQTFASAAIGIGVTALFAALADIASRPAGHHDWEWLRVVFFCAVVAMAIIAALCLVAHSHEEAQFVTDVNVVTDHIDRMEKMWESGATP